MTLTQEITLDIFEAPLFEYINAKQEDNVSRVLVATITANGETLQPDHNKARAIFRATKPDKTGVMDPATIGEDGKITFALTDQVLAVPGDVAAEIAIVEGDQVLTTATFYIQVERRQGGTNVTSENEFLFLVEATKKAETAAENADAATERANTAAEGADKSRQDADEAESERAAAEALRVTAEEGRTEAEAGRVAAEEQRDTAEQARSEAETQRGLSESDRQTAEDQRASAEEARQEAETGRETAEQVRTEAEANRKEWYEQAAAAVAEALRSMGVAEEYVKGITVSAHPVEAGGEPTAEAGDQDGHLHIDFGLVAGADGVSPMVDVIKEGKTTTVTITDAAGPHTITIQDGKDGTGTGDMEKSVYDPQGKATDVFQAIEDAMKNVKIDMDAVPTESSQNAVQSGGVWSELQKKPNPNLLDNWYFVGGGSQQGGGRFPINQRGQTKYTSATYTIDRWEERISNTSLTVNPEYITIVDQSSGEGYAFLTQSMENPKEFAGKQVTFSVLVRPEKDTQCKATIRDDVESQWTAATPVSVKAVEWNLVSVTVTVKSALSYLGFQAWEHNTQYDLLAMKLELGDHQTLAHKEGDTWVLNEIPNFQQELAKCQRYYQIFETETLRPTKAQDFRPPMRVKPTLGTIVVNGTTYYTADANL